MNIEKADFNKEMYYAMLDLWRCAPEHEMTPRIRNKVVDFFSVDHSSKECYEFCDDIANNSTGEISNFVKVLFDVRKVYKDF